MSKTSKRRPAAISEAAAEANWERTFGPKPAPTAPVWECNVTDFGSLLAPLDTSVIPD